MGGKTVKITLAETLEDLTKDNFEKFVHHLLDRREEPRIRRSSVEGKNYLGVTDVLVSAFTEAGAPRVVVELLRGIGCNEEAARLGRRPSAGAIVVCALWRRYALYTFSQSACRKKREEKIRFQKNPAANVSHRKRLDGSVLTKHSSS
ncbi:hypothetical protein INR49_024653 [Caranx melampygus]|nr:hypothetical protein INR49_024653 [Caranx melampygus]